MPAAPTGGARLIFDINVEQRFAIAAFLKVLSLNIAGYFSQKPYRSFLRSQSDKRVVYDFTLTSTTTSLTDLIVSLPARLDEFPKDRGGFEVGRLLLGVSDLYEFPDDALGMEFDSPLLASRSDSEEEYSRRSACIA